MVGLALGALLIGLSFSSGGYFPDSYLSAGVVTWLLVALLAAVSRPRARLRTPALLALAALSGLTFWTGLSAQWSPLPGAAVADLQHTFCYLGLLVLGLAASAGGHARGLARIVWVAVLVVAVAGVASRVLPDVVHATPDRMDYRLGWPLGYWNAFGALCAMGAVLGAGLAADPRQPALLRGAFAAGAVIEVCGAYLSFSRGTWLATIVGTAILLVIGVRRVRLLLTLLGIGGLAAVAVLRLSAYPALTTDPTAGIGQVRAGHAVAATLAVLALAAGSLQVLIAQAEGWSGAAPLSRRTRWIIRGVSTAVIVAATGVLLLRSTTVDGRPGSGADAAASWVQRQWQDFLHPAAFAGSGLNRLTTSKGTRAELYRVALAEFSSHPIRGDGAGAFRPYYLRHRRISETVINAHSLELETLAELGVVGAMLLLVLLASIATAAARARRRARGLGRTEAAAVAAAVSVWVAHSAVDWDWQISALTGTALVLSATLFGRERISARTTSFAA